MNKKILGYFLIIIGLFIYIYKTLDTRNKIEIESNKIEYSLNKEKNYKYLNIDDLYDMVLVIPKINLKKGIYKKENKKNNINTTVAIHKLQIIQI